MVICRSAGEFGASVLEEAGVPAVAAERLASLLKDSESMLPPKQVELFSSFEGVVHVDAEDDGHRHHGHSR
jgi:hypothetical protein